MADLIRKLKPHVSTFSAAVPTHYKHGDTITVGGVITNVLNMTELLDYEEDDSNQLGVYITLDDGIGKNEIVLPNHLFLKAKQLFDMKLGDVVLAEGRLFRVDTTHTYEGQRGKKVTVDNHDTETLRVLTYIISPLPEENLKKEVEASEK